MNAPQESGARTRLQSKAINGAVRLPGFYERQWKATDR